MMPSSDTMPFGKKLRRKIESGVIQAVLGLLRALPYHWRVPFCGWIAERLISPLANWPRRIRENLMLAMPEMPEAEIRRMVRAVPNNVGRAMIESYSGAEFVDRAALQPFTGPGVDALNEANLNQRPVIFATAHLGNYEALRARANAQGYPLGVLYRKMRNPYFNAYYIQALASLGTPIFERGHRGMAEMVRHLGKGGMLGILPDQRITSGQKVAFFGHEALTGLSAAKMALKYDALIIPSFAIRRADGLSFDLILEEPIAHGSAEEMIKAYNASLENIIRQHPEQWLWTYHRWKL